MNGLIQFVKQEPYVQTKGERLVARLLYNRRWRMPKASEFSERLQSYEFEQSYPRRAVWVMPPPRYGKY